MNYIFLLKLFFHIVFKICTKNIHTSSVMTSRLSRYWKVNGKSDSDLKVAVWLKSEIIDDWLISGLFFGLSSWIKAQSSCSYLGWFSVTRFDYYNVRSLKVTWPVSIQCLSLIEIKAFILESKSCKGFFLTNRISTNERPWIFNRSCDF